MARTANFMVGLLLMICWAAMAESAKSYYKYKDPKQPLNVRIRDLLDRMTLEEKIGQMVQIDRSVASSDVMKKYLIGRFSISSLFSSLSKFKVKHRIVFFLSVRLVEFCVLQVVFWVVEEVFRKRRLHRRLGSTWLMIFRRDLCRPVLGFRWFTESMQFMATTMSTRQQFFHTMLV